MADPTMKVEVELPESLKKLGEQLEAIRAGIAKLEGTPPGTSPTLTSDLVTLKTEFAKAEKELLQARAELQKQLEDTTKELQASRQEAMKIRAQRRRELFIKRAGELSHLPGAPADDFAEILDCVEAGLKSLDATKGEQQFTKFNTMLSSWNELVKKSAAFAEFGRGGSLPNLTGAEGALMVLAKERAEKDKITVEQAMAKLLRERPELYARYRIEKES